MTRDEFLGTVGAPSLLPEQQRDPRAPSGGWFSAGAIQGWQGVATGNTNATTVGRQIVWTTPVYDVRPEFGAWPQPTASPQNRGQVPIWPNKAHGYAQLFVEIAITGWSGAAGLLSGINITATTVGHPWDPNALRVVVPEQDISMYFLSSNSPRKSSPIGAPGYFGQATTEGFATFCAPGSADSPMRFWQLQIAITNWRITPSDPIVVIQAGYY
ncbi:MAG: hypothetical protein KGS10_04215 [Chloroflexi bacterium]|nr:hypothetical protein [Chloroflexota bacterium]